jgi:putative transposase
MAGHPGHRGQESQSPSQGEGTTRESAQRPGKLVEGKVVNGWKEALGALTVANPDRLAPYIN